MKLFQIADLIQKNLEITSKIVKKKKCLKIAVITWNYVSLEKWEPC